jgi:hypothetical protein
VKLELKRTAVRRRQDAVVPNHVRISDSLEETSERRSLATERLLICLDVCEQWELFGLALSAYCWPVVTTEGVCFGSIEAWRSLSMIDFGTEIDE